MNLTHLPVRRRRHIDPAVVCVGLFVLLAAGVAATILVLLLEARPWARFFFALALVGAATLGSVALYWRDARGASR